MKSHIPRTPEYEAMVFFAWNDKLKHMPARWLDVYGNRSWLDCTSQTESKRNSLHVQRREGEYDLRQRFPNESWHWIMDNVDKRCFQSACAAEVNQRITILTGRGKVRPDNSLLHGQGLIGFPFKGRKRRASCSLSSLCAQVPKRDRRRHIGIPWLSVARHRAGSWYR